MLRCAQPWLRVEEGDWDPDVHGHRAVRQRPGQPPIPFQSRALLYVRFATHPLDYFSYPPTLLQQRLRRIVRPRVPRSLVHRYAGGLLIQCFTPATSRSLLV